jgi:hypothetical protein
MARSVHKPDCNPAHAVCQKSKTKNPEGPKALIGCPARSRRLAPCSLGRASDCPRKFRPVLGYSLSVANGRKAECSDETFPGPPLDVRAWWPPFRTFQVHAKDLRVLPRHPERAVSWHSGFRGGAHARRWKARVHHAARRRRGRVAARGARVAFGDAIRRARIACPECPCKEEGFNHVNMPVQRNAST